MQEEIPDWLQPGRLIDAKDKHGDWQVALILRAFKNQVKVRFDGWQAKYDENFSFHSSNIQPFRSVVRGYTGQVKNAGIRQHFLFNLAESEETCLPRLESFLEGLQQKSVDQITQVLRGHHYIWVDYLLTQHFTDFDDFKHSYIYFCKHMNLNCLYISEMLKVGLSQWFNNPTENIRAFAESHFEIFDATYSILEGYPRHREFFTVHPALIMEMAKPADTNLKYWHSKFIQIGFYALFEKMINTIENSPSVKLPLSFIRSLCYLFIGVEKTMTDKEAKDRMAQTISKIAIRQCMEVTEATVKADEKDVEDIYVKLKMVMFNYNFKTVMQRMEVARLNCWEKMIRTQSLDRKVRGINNIKRYFEILSSEDSKQTQLLVGELSQRQEWLRDKKLVQLVFCHNEHHEIIKKGCELATTLYTSQSIDEKELTLIWNSCRSRLEAVRKVIYNFFEKIVKYASTSHLFSLAKLISAHELTEAYDVAFYYAFAEEVVENKKDSSELIHTILGLAMQRAQDHPQEISRFATLLVINNQDIIKHYIQHLVTKIGHKGHTNFSLKVLIEVYANSDAKEFETQDFDSFKHVFDQLRRVLKNVAEDSQDREETLDMLLKLLECLEEETEFPIEVFQEVWELFNQEGNIGVRNKIFYKWVLQTSQEGIFKIEGHSVNRALRDSELQAQIFERILKNTQVLDYINMDMQEFSIFRQFLLDVNQAEKNLIMHHHKFTGLSYFRSASMQINGLNELWNIFFNCRDILIVPKVAELLKDLYLNSPDAHLSAQIGGQEKEKRINSLLLRLDKNIKSGLQKLNMKLITRSLLLLRQVIIDITESKKHPTELHLSGNFPESKRIIRWKYEDHEREKELSMTEPLKLLKNMVEKEFHIKPYFLRVFKNSVSYKFGESKIPRSGLVEEEIPKEQLFLPLFTIVMGQEKLYFSFKKVPNPSYELLANFINSRMEESLIKILSESDQLSHQNSECAYNILLAIPSQKTPSEVISNLMAQHTDKDSLLKQSVYYRMYLARNMNSMPKEQLKSLISGGWAFESMLREFDSPFVAFINIELINEIVCLAYAAVKLMDISLTSQKILQCMINLLGFVAASPHHSDPKEKKKLELFSHLFSLLQILYKKNHYELLSLIVESQHFSPLINFLYKDKRVRREYRSIFDGKISLYVKDIKKHQPHCLSQTAENLLFNIILKDLYSYVCLPENKHGYNNSFFRLLKEMISILSPENLDKLYTAKEQWASGEGAKTFWETCFDVVKEESDFPKQSNQENSFFSGHLQTLQILILKNPAKISEDFINFIFFDCLFYDLEHTKVSIVKCQSQRSVQIALSILQIFCLFEDEHFSSVIDYLRRIQKNQYWRTPDKWNINLELETKSETGYVGLDNPGCICYLNSFIQTLFMNKEFRSKVINYQEPKTEEGAKKDKNILAALKELFMNLEFSDKKFLSPLEFSRTLRTTDNKPLVKMYEQMDIEQFSSILFDRLDSLLPSNQNFVKDLYQGVFSNEVISQECKHCSEREECFLSIQINVKNSVEQSLKTLVKGEMLEGENAYYCERCDKKVRALKRVSLKKLPDHLLICIKRFQYNFEIDQKIKLNSYCEFSENFNLQEFSQQFLNAKEGQETKGQETQPKEYFQYKLKGVIIHTGFADSGHYYTLEEVEPGRWLEFNDNFVTQFNIDRLADEAYGSKDGGDNKVKNAYMLVYERKNKLRREKMMESVAVHGQQENSNKLDKLSHIHNPEALNLYRNIEALNKEIHMFHLFFGSDYYHFMKNLVTKTYNKVKDAKSFQKVMNLIVQHTLLIRGRDNSLLLLIQNLCLIEENIMKPEDPLKAHMPNILIEEVSKKDFIYEFFVEPLTNDRPIIFSRFISEVITKKLKTADAHFLSLILKMVCAFLEVMIETEAVYSELCYIIRRIIQAKDVFYKYFEELSVSVILFDNLTGTRLTPEDKQEKLIKLSLTLKDLLQSQGQEQTQEMGQKGFGISRIVKKQYKIGVRSEYFEEIWYLIFKLYVKQEEVLEIGSRAGNSQGENQAESAEEHYKIVSTHHQYLLSQFECLSPARLSHFFQSSSNSKAATCLSYLLCEISKDNELRTEKVLNLICSSLKGLEVIKFRPYLIALYHLAEMNDEVQEYRFCLMLKHLDAIFSSNKKYFSEVDILLQWIHKMCACNPLFVREIEGTEFVGELIEISQMHSKPTTDMIKKQRNPNYERHLYKLHGLMVSTDFSDYDQLFHDRNYFLDRLFQKLYTSSLDKTLKEPSLMALEKGYAPGDQIMLFHEKEWMPAVVKEVRYGLVSLCVRGTEENCFRWENDERVKEIEEEASSSEMEEV